MGCHGLGQVYARQAGIGQHGVNDVALDFEALVTGGLFAEVPGQQVGEGHAAALGVVDKQASAALDLDALLDIDGLLLAAGGQGLLGLAGLANANDVGVVGAGQLGLEALSHQVGDALLERSLAVEGEGLGEVVAVLDGDDAAGTVLDRGHGLAPVG